MKLRHWLIVAVAALAFALVMTNTIRDWIGPTAPAVIELYSVSPSIVTPGATVAIVIVVTRSRADCQVSIVRQVADVHGLIRTYQVPEWPLADADAGTHEIRVEATLPDDIRPGPARARSVGTYECPDGTFQVVSPWADLMIVASG